MFLPAVRDALDSWRGRLVERDCSIMRQSASISRGCLTRVSCLEEDMRILRKQ